MTHSSKEKPMSLENAERAFAHAATQDPDDALAIILEGLAELTSELATLKRDLAELKAASPPQSHVVGQGSWEDRT
jgi:hypothetical protein